MMGPVRTWAQEAAPEHRSFNIYSWAKPLKVSQSIPSLPKPQFPSLQEPPAALTQGMCVYWCAHMGVHMHEVVVKQRFQGLDRLLANHM